MLEIERHQVELGTEGRLTEMQLRELSVGIVPDPSAMVREHVVWALAEQESKRDHAGQASH